jgi:hypothetical protein
MIEGLKQLKADAPANYRDIKATRQAQPISRKLAEEIKTIWEKMLLDVKHPKEVIDGMDGVTYNFSAWVKGRGEISGHIWSPKSGSKTGKLTSLVLVMGDYARGKVDLGTLNQKVAQTRASINP